MGSITITIPIPHKCLSQNARPHWATRAKHFKGSKNATIAACLEVCDTAPMWDHAAADAVWFHKTGNRPDYGNAWGLLKAAFDGIEAAFIVIDDKNLRTRDMTFIKDAKNPRVVLTITQVKPS